jgi:hypothetical protein
LKAGFVTAASCNLTKICHCNVADFFEEFNMIAVKQVRKIIQDQADSPQAQTLSALVLALENEDPFDVSSLYELDFDTFELALTLLKEWRLDRYYSSKAKLVQASSEAMVTKPVTKKPR